MATNNYQQSKPTKKEYRYSLWIQKINWVQKDEDLTKIVMKIEEDYHYT